MMDSILTLNQVEVSILAFAGARDLLLQQHSRVNESSNDQSNNGGEIRLTLQSSWPRAYDLRKFLCQIKWPQLQPIEQTIAIALNLKYLSLNESVEINSGDTIALIPPISGG